MKLEELLLLCKFYGKQDSSFTNCDEELVDDLSSIERHVVDMLACRELMQGEDLHTLFEDHVAAMIGKWHPFECNELWELYSSR